MIEKGVLKITPIEKSTPPEAEALAARLYAMLPRIRITDLLAEGAGWTRFPDRFTYLRTGGTVADRRILMAGLLADGLNLGLTRMAEACSIASLSQLERISISTADGRPLPVQVDGDHVGDYEEIEYSVDAGGLAIVS